MKDYEELNSLLLYVSILHCHTQEKPAAISKSPGGAQPRFEIKKWNAVAMWSWDICADTVRLPNCSDLPSVVFILRT